MMLLPHVRYRAPLEDGSGLVSELWRDWFTILRRLVNWAWKTEQMVSLTEQSAAITTTAIPLNTLPAGVYLLSWYLRITTPGTVSSSTQLSFTWVDGGVTLTKTGGVINGNTTATYESGSVLIRVDKDSAVNYAATYASAGATPMKFALDLVLTHVPKANLP